MEAAAAASAAVAEAPPHSGKVFTTGDHWIAFLDDDDEWLPVKLERQLTRMGSDGTLMACGGAVEVVRTTEEDRTLEDDHEDSGNAASSSSSSSSSPAPSMPRGAAALPSVLTSQDLAFTNVVVASSMVVHRSVAAAAGEFNDQRYGQDYDYWKRCLAVLPAPVSPEPAPPPPPPPPPVAVVEQRRVPREGCSFVCETLVRYGVGGLQRSSVEKEVRQSVRAVLQQKAAADDPPKNDTSAGATPPTSTDTAPRGTFPFPGAGGAGTPADLINGFLGF